MKISLYKLNKLVQDYPIIKDMIENIQMIEYHGDMSKQSIVELILKDIPNEENFVINKEKYLTNKEYCAIIKV